MYSCCQLAIRIYSTFRVSALIYHIGIYPRITDDNQKKVHPQTWYISFGFIVIRLICILYHNGNHNHALIYKNMFIEFTPSSLAYNSYTHQRTYEPGLVYMKLTCMSVRAIIAHV